MRLLARGVGASVLICAAYGAAFHTPLKGKLGLTGGSCPFAAGQSSEVREQHRRAAAAKLRGALPALARPALGFDLEGGTREQVSTWAAQAAGRCAEAQATGDLECKIPEAGALPGTALRGPGTLFFTFNDQDQLRSVQLMATVQAADAAASALQLARTRLEHELRLPARVVGEADATYLAGGPLRQTLAEFRFSNYYASTRATNMGGMGHYVVSETYQSLRD